MKLAIPNESLEEQLLEFDVWVTPQLTDISATDKYQSEMRQIRSALDYVENIGTALNSEQSANLPVGEVVAKAFTKLLISDLNTSSDAEAALAFAQARLSALAATLFLVTGKSDNNNKCQFPLHLQRTLEWESLPVLNKRKKKGQIVFVSAKQRIPRVLKADTYMNIVGGLLAFGMQTGENQRRECFKHALNLLAQFVAFVLSDEPSKEQFLEIVTAYHYAKNNNRNPEALLAPLVRFQVRGSVSATGGHEPEEILREKLSDWGMKRDRDFNIADVVLDVEAGRLLENTETESEEVKKALSEKGKGKKTRAYDFVLPFRTDGWTPRLFIQSQYYAGDSGSVSHKVVDQTTASRENAKQLLEKVLGPGNHPRFIEYVDGAGYFASLNGDLKRILQMDDTKSFFQVKSSPIRLRRELQDIGYLTPLEIEHALMLSEDEAKAREHLVQEGYSEQEVERAINDAKTRGLLNSSSEGIAVSTNRSLLARRYLLLDLIARSGASFGNATGLKGVVLVPGFGPYFGIELSELGKIIEENAPGVWKTASCFCDDLAWLAKQGFIIQR
ncbi:hypothetical protein [Marinobacter sp. RI1]|uniref:hypothetical protein n=1 Tax=Marinobacter sp. RI1 TaxID=3158171 RepID=UPI0034E8B08E